MIGDWNTHKREGEHGGIVQLTGSYTLLEKYSDNVRDAIERVAFTLWKRSYPNGSASNVAGQIICICPVAAWRHTRQQP